MDLAIDNTVIKKRTLLKMLELYATAIFFILAGARHFITPDYYIKMMPSYLPAHNFLVYTSGFFAIIGGIGLLIPRLRSFSAWGIMGLLLAVLPANINLYTHNVEMPNLSTPGWFLLARIGLQFFLIAWIFTFVKNTEDF